MSVKKYKFVSPGVFLSEIDNSQLPEEPVDIGPVLIGRSARGPAMRPVQVNSFSEFVTMFGGPAAQDTRVDVWRRDDSTGAPLYAVYAAQAWLKNNSPLTFVRLLGEESSSKTTAGSAGWFTRATSDQTFHGNSNAGGGAYGLFIAPSSSMSTHNQSYVTGTLAAVWYFNNGTIALSGTSPGLTGSTEGVYPFASTTSSAGQWIQSLSGEKAFVANVYASGAAGATTEKITFSLNRNSNNYIRKVFNTDPAKSNSMITTNYKEYFLGETFERCVNDQFITGSNLGYGGNGALEQTVSTADCYGAILPLKLSDSSANTERGDMRKVNQAAQTGWFFSQDLNAVTAADSSVAVEDNTFEARDNQKLFKIVALDTGRWASSNLKISIANIKQSFNSTDLFGTFTVELRRIDDTDAAVQIIERFDNCNLNPDSPHYISKIIGDKYQTWDATNTRYTEYGEYANNSKFVRVVVDPDVTNRTINESCIPFGVFGPPRFRGFSAISGTATQALDDNGNGPLGSTSYFVIGASTSSFANNAVPAIFDTSSPSAIVYPGGQYTSPAAAATSIITITTITAVADGEKFVLTDTAGTEHTFTFNTSVDTTTGNIIGIATAWTTSDNGAACTQIANTINAGTCAGTITANRVGATVELEQDVKGVAGNTSITGDATETGAGTFAAFTGGTGEDFGGYTAALEFPKIFTRVSSSDGNNSSPSSVYWGADTSMGSAGYNIYNQATPDVLRMLPANVDDFGAVSTTSNLEYSWIFTLDDITQEEGLPGFDADIAPNALHRSGSRQRGFSITAMTGTYQSVLDLGFNAFTTVMHGGGDGLDIYEKDPFNNTRALASSKTELNSYAYYSIKKALDSIIDPEVVEYNLASIPGVTNTKLTNYLVNVCEDRGDSLAVIDLPGVYVPAWDAGTGGATRAGVATVVTALKDRALDSSYACTYFPWVQIQDTINNNTLWAPPSVAALGTFSSSEKASHLWFAPAGFNRGGLSDGSAGIPVVGVRDKLTSKQRDKLYEANINPIASFPAEGIVIFGQKTLQLQQSALDRINVRRLMIYVKKQISRMANGILFDQNVQATWDRFLAEVEPFLSGIQSDFGLTDFKVVLDETTTTPELIDRNILYAKIFLKPARAIEYIAIDFNITSTGAAFED